MQVIYTYKHIKIAFGFDFGYLLVRLMHGEIEVVDKDISEKEVVLFVNLN